MTNFAVLSHMFILIFDFVSVVCVYFLLGPLISGVGYVHFVFSCSGVCSFFPLNGYLIYQRREIYINNG